MFINNLRLTLKLEYDIIKELGKEKGRFHLTAKHRENLTFLFCSLNGLFVSTERGLRLPQLVYSVTEFGSLIKLKRGEN